MKWDILIWVPYACPFSFTKQHGDEDMSKPENVEAQAFSGEHNYIIRLIRIVK